MANGPSRRTVLGTSGAMLVGVVSSLSGGDIVGGPGEAGGATAGTVPDASGGRDRNVDRDEEGPGTDRSADPGSETADPEHADRSGGPDRPENGAVVVVYDDGPIEDYTEALPAHREFDAPAVAGIVTEWIGREDFLGTDWMTLSHLEELVDAGWEIASHTTDHTAVGTAPLVAGATPDSTRLYPDHVRHGLHAGLTVEVADGDRTVRRTVAGHGSDDDGAFVELDAPIGESFPDGSSLRYPAEHVRASAEESKRELEGFGFDVETFLAPYDVFDAYSRPIVAGSYDGVVNARPGSPVNDPDGFDPLYTRRDYFIEFTTPDAVERELDAIADRGALGVIGAHTFKPEVTTERIRETLDRIADRGIEVLTMQEALSTYAGLDDR